MITNSDLMETRRQIAQAMRAPTKREAEIFRLISHPPRGPARTRVTGLVTRETGSAIGLLAS
jgi:hypothetical protein